MKHNTAPIGFFDSGVGGLSVYTAIQTLLPYENTVYVADSAHCPYGNKPIDELVDLCERITRFLLNCKVKIIVIACNTATSGAIEELRKSFPHIQFVGTEPAIKPAAENSLTGKIGVLATANTFKGRLFMQSKKRYAANVEVLEQTGNGLVELVEQGNTSSPEACALLEKYINPMLEAGVDQLVLGCTHYPFLRPLMEEITQGKVTILDGAAAIAKQTARLLIKSGLNAPQTQQPTHTFYSTGNPAILQQMVEQLSLPQSTIKGYIAI